MAAGSPSTRSPSSRVVTVDATLRGVELAVGRSTRSRWAADSSRAVESHAVSVDDSLAGWWVCCSSFEASSRSHWSSTAAASSAPTRNALSSSVASVAV
jgi:hypothetical protein